MEEFKVYPDFNKLKDYFAPTDAQIKNIESKGIDLLDSNYGDGYNLRVINEIKSLCEKHEIQEHFTEFVYLVIFRNERLAQFKEALWENYHDDPITSQVANFLLAFKKSVKENNFQLSIKSDLQSATIKDQNVARWMTNLIYKELESGNMPFDVFGMKARLDLFGNDKGEADPFDLDTLELATELNPKSPKVQEKKMIIEFTLFLRPFIEKYTYMKRDEGVKLTNKQAQFFYDLFVILGDINHKDVRTTDINYFHSLFKRMSL